MTSVHTTLGYLNYINLYTEPQMLNPWFPMIKKNKNWIILVALNKTTGNYSQWHLHLHLHSKRTSNKSICDFVSVPFSQKKKKLL